MATPIPDNSATFTLDEVAAAVGGRVRGPGADRVVGVTTDSRRAGPGKLFVALRGERHDAHRFIPAVADAGATAAIVARGSVVPPSMTAIEVDDTLGALGRLGLHHRQRWGGRVIAITGSAGKTTTKELTAAALAGAGRRVLKTEGNLNNLIGVPMTLLTLEGNHDVAVIEIGTSAPGEIAALTAMSAPNLGIVTTVAAAHTEGLGTVERVADEKLALLEGLPDDAVGLYGADNELLVSRATGLLGERARGFGRSPAAFARLTSQGVDSELRSHCRFQVANRACEATLSWMGLGPAVDAAAALATVVCELGEEALDGALAGLAQVPPVAGRLCAVRGPRGSLIIDDTYNANPASVHASLETLAQVGRARGGRTVAVLGDMKELGELSTPEHRRVGQTVADLGIDQLVTCGPLMSEAAATAGAAAVTCVDAATEAEAHLGALGSGDTVLVKGSRSMAMEQLVTSLAQLAEVRT